MAESAPQLRIAILEQSNKLLSKVRISGGGRCNVTHDCPDAVRLSHHYPRGAKFLKTLFRNFHTSHTVEWFRKKGVQLKTEDDGRMFPVTDSAQTIIDTFINAALSQEITILPGEGVVKLERSDKFYLYSRTGRVFESLKVLVATGGNPSVVFYKWIADTGHKIASPIPSLFTFNDPSRRLSDLMGVAVPNAAVRIVGTDFVENGPLLITHWGLSGPAVIKLSAWAAVHLHSVNYDFKVLVSWIGTSNEEEVRSQLEDQRKLRARQKVCSHPLFSLPRRLWERICELAGVDENRSWSELPRKNMNRLLEFLIRFPFEIRGKTTFKEEFVTCGGVELSDVHPSTLESRTVPGLFFAGEVLNVDGETGGFNFQAAWTTATIAARSIVKAFAERASAK